MERSKKESKHKRNGSCSTRLQKHAPPTLLLRGITAEAEEDGSSSRYAIPLLSPLLVSPAVPPVVVDVKGKELASGGGNVMAGSSTTMAEGWKHPAVGALAEPSDLGALLQSQCMLINNVSS
ncbi:hypothetical protein CDL12_22181 [Handroanthus impetiginosus]|uniref:Uncharacterized protein n=1 Tax=Handroanthus impetiginosus TaxID=429701 RepID=A0A2G9GJB8_9LAMI|nr:hypothetical protein CDL12_22181 [Handroanthus impetiginosus]